MTLIGHLPYTCVKIESGMAYLKVAGDEQRGRYKKMEAILDPYVDEKGELIVPKPPPVSRKKMLRFNFMKAVRDEVELPVSHDLAYCIAEHLEHIVSQLASIAESNALEKGHDRITAAHWYWLDLAPGQGKGYWIENRDHSNDYKNHLRYNQ